LVFGDNEHYCFKKLICFYYIKSFNTMTILQFTTKRLVPAFASVGVGTWATLTTVNDDWDDYTHHPWLSSNKDKTEKVVILGGGWGGLNALRKCAGPNKEIVMVSPRPHFLYTPLLAGSSVGTVTLRSACEPLRNLVNVAASKSAGATFVRAHAREVDTKNKSVKVTCGESGSELHLKYDKLIVAVGSVPNTFGIPGVAEHALFLKEAEDSTRLHAKLLSNLEKAAALMQYGADQYEAEIDRLLRVVIVGGGPTGVELTAELADFVENDARVRYGDAVAQRVRIDLIEALPRVLGPFCPQLAQVATEHLERRGVNVCTATVVTAASANTVTLAPSTPRTATKEEKEAALRQAREEPVGFMVWAAGIGSRPLVKKLATALGQSDLRGIKVDSCLRVEGADGVYAIGDAALDGHAPTAQVASQEGKHVGRALRDGTDVPFVYQHSGSLCSLGQNNGIAQLMVGKTANNSVWDAVGVPTVGKDADQRAVTGVTALAMWRSLYWSKVMSHSSRFHLSFDWIKARFTGRDVVEPPLRRSPTLANVPVPSPKETSGFKKFWSSQ